MLMVASGRELAAHKSSSPHAFVAPGTSAAQVARLKGHVEAADLLQLLVDSPFDAVAAARSKLGLKGFFFFPFFFPLELSFPLSSCIQS